ncbi:IclR family transcriptional regulator domain-containing protein [Nocardia sp. NPDC003963]
MSPTTAPDEELVTSLLRGLEVLDILGSSQKPLTLAEVARAVDTTRATARRFLLTYEHMGYVATNGPTFWLRPKIMELGDIYLDSLGLTAVAHPWLAALAHEVRDTCSLTVLDGDSVVYVDRVKASRVLRVNIAVGTRLPAFATSTGRVLLADLDDERLQTFLSDLHAEPLTGRTRTDPAEIARMIAAARTDGYAIADQELDPVLRSVAAPVRGMDGRAVAAVNVSTHVTRTSLEQLRESILPRLLDTAAAISAALTAAAR